MYEKITSEFKYLLKKGHSSNVWKDKIRTPKFILIGQAFQRLER